MHRRREVTAKPGQVAFEERCSFDNSHPPPSSSPVPKLSEFSQASHADIHSNSRKHTRKRVFQAKHSSSHAHITAAHQPARLDPAASHRAHRVAPYANAGSAASESADDGHHLISSGRSMTPTRIRGTPSPGRRNPSHLASSAENPLTPAGRRSGGRAEPDASPRSLTPDRRFHRDARQRNPLLGTGLDAGDGRAHSPEHKVRGAGDSSPRAGGRTSKRDSEREMRSAARLEEFKESLTLDHDPTAPIATSLLSSDKMRAVAPRSKTFEVGQHPALPDGGLSRVLGVSASNPVSCVCARRLTVRVPPLLLLPQSTGDAVDGVLHFLARHPAAATRPLTPLCPAGLCRAASGFESRDERQARDRCAVVPSALP